MSGSDTIVRYAVVLAALCGKPLRIINARQRRRKAGLRPQHVTGVRACADLCGATLDGREVGSCTVDFIPALWGTASLHSDSSTAQRRPELVPLECICSICSRHRSAPARPPPMCTIAEVSGSRSASATKDPQGHGLRWNGKCHRRPSQAVALAPTALTSADLQAALYPSAVRLASLIATPDWLTQRNS